MSNNNLAFDFLVDKEKNTIRVVKEFAANRPLVWDCYTKSELLDQWFAPQPWKTRTKTMDFRPGGCWLYAMCGPEGEEHWGRMDYESIRPIENYTAWDGFCDPEGNIQPELPRAQWVATFSDKGENAVVETVVTYRSLNDLETVINMGMKEGLTVALEGLDELLDSLQNK
jgi:uncharacterized protein YndB with AHSA1/START domain